MLSYEELEKCEYLTGEDLGYKPGVVNQAKLEYSLLGKVFHQGLNEKNKKERLLKKLKGIEEKNEEQVKMIENKQSK